MVRLLERAPVWQRRSEKFRHPAQMIAGGFAVAVGVGTALLSLPVATASGRRADLLDALFTATSAVCVTGLVTVDTGSYWSGFGQGVILLLIQGGGLGIMTLATLVTVLLSRRMGLRARLLTQAETRSLQLTDLRGLVLRIVAFSLVSEAAVAVVLTVRYLVGYADPLGSAVYLGVFHAVSAFNNAGFSPHADNLTRYVADPWVCLTVAAAIILGGLGFPVVFELARTWRRPSRWSVMTRVTVVLTVALLVVGTVVFTLVEWTNRHTFGPLDGASKLLAGFFASVNTRTAGFNSVNIGALRPESLLATDILMFIGGGSAGTAGGIKVTTLGVLAFVVWSEIRGETHVNVRWRRIPASNQRQAFAVGMLGVTAVVASTFLLLSMTTFALNRLLFEAISAFATVGLSTGITADLPPRADILLIVLMFAGRIGPLTLMSALALRERTRRFELPEERTIVG